MIQPPDLSRRFARNGVLLLWLLCATTLIVSRWTEILSLTFGDPDDALRYVQVSDWMAGQGWFDVSQYRGSAMDSAPMHWSRLVDVPVAALLGLARLIVAQPLADRIALTLLPLLLLLALAAIVFAMTRTLTGRRDTALVGVLLFTLSLAVTTQFKPLRIDHHGWQIVLGALAVLAALGHRGRPVRQGMASGAAMALSLVIAIEGLPLAVGIAGVLALAFIRGKADAQALTAYVTTLFVGSAGLSLLLLGWSGASVTWCDAMSPAYFLPLGAVALVLGSATATGIGASTAARIAILAFAGLAGGAVLLSVAPACAAGPFAGLDPVVQSVWYRNIPEGLPIWTQTPDLRLLVPLPSIIGLVGTLLAIRIGDEGRRSMWIDLLLLQIVAFGVSMMVMRALGIAHVLALPGAAFLFLIAFRYATSLRFSAARVLLSVSSVAITPIGAQGIAAGASDDRFAEVAANDAKESKSCLTAEALRGLGALPPATLFAPVDIGSHLLAYTHHSVVATGHHRNRNGMKAVITGFMAKGEAARAIITATPADFVAFCPGANESDKYAETDRASLMAMLMAGHPPTWLQPVRMLPGEPIRVYRILRDQPGTKPSASPFMQ